MSRSRAVFDKYGPALSGDRGKDRTFIHDSSILIRAVFKGGGVYGFKPPEILEKIFLAHENLQYF
jgi:hypothetical protein